jgi:hypothetical protein
MMENTSSTITTSSLLREAEWLYIPSRSESPYRLEPLSSSRLSSKETEAFKIINILMRYLIDDLKHDTLLDNVIDRMKEEILTRKQSSS